MTVVVDERRALDNAHVDDGVANQIKWYRYHLGITIGDDGLAPSGIRRLIDQMGPINV